MREKSRIDLLRGTDGAFNRRPEMQTAPDAALVPRHPLEQRRQGPRTEVAEKVFVLGHLDHRLHERVECLVGRVIAPLARGCLLTGDFPRQEKRIPCGAMRCRLNDIGSCVSAGRSRRGQFFPRSPMFLFAARSHWKMRDPLIAFPNFDRGYVYSVRLSTLKFT